MLYKGEKDINFYYSALCVMVLKRPKSNGFIMTRGSKELASGIKCDSQCTSSGMFLPYESSTDVQIMYVTNLDFMTVAI